jgi:hypothetical protein
VSIRSSCLEPDQRAQTAWRAGVELVEPPVTATRCASVGAGRPTAARQASVDWMDRSGSPVVLVDDAAEDVATNDSTVADRRHPAGDRSGELQAAMRSRFVVVPDVLGEDLLERSTGASTTVSVPPSPDWRHGWC